jgi:hypothetical protein
MRRFGMQQRRSGSNNLTNFITAQDIVVQLLSMRRRQCNNNPLKA